MMPQPKDTQQILTHWREHVPNDRLAHLIRDVARAQMKALQRRLAPHGVSFGHWTFLRILWIRDGLTQKELSDLAGVMEPTTFSAIKAMEKMGFIVRRQLSGNRKNIHIFLTPLGQSLRDLLVPMAEEVNNISIRGLPESAISALREHLLLMIENIAEDEARADSLVTQCSESKDDQL